MSVELAVEAGLKSGSSKFDLISGESHYSNVSGTVRVVSDLGGNLHLPDPLTTTYIEAEITTDYSITAPNTLTANLTLPTRAELVNEVLGPIADALRLGGWFGLFLLQLAQNAARGSAPAPTIPNCTKISETNYVCVKTIPAPVLAGGSQLTFTRLAALDDGISLGGMMRIVPLTPPMLDLLTVRQFQFTPPHVTCGLAGPEIVAAFQAAPGSFAVLHGEVDLDNEGTTPIFLCSLQVLNDPQGAFPASAIRATPSPLPVRVTIDVPVPSATYYAAPYPCDLLAVTTGGIRLVRLDPPPVLTQQDIDKMIGLLILALGNCEQLVDPWFLRFRRYNPKWSVDPPFGEQVEHIWQIEISGLQEGERVTLANVQGQEIMRAVARASVPVRLLARVSPAGDGGVSLLPRAAPREGATTEGRTG
jgi:hypothetical protein